MLKKRALIGRRDWIIAIVATAALAIGLIVLLTWERHLPSDAADGSYSHDCCGTLELRDGEMSANGVNWVSYIVERDETGPYILPETFVGTLDRGIERDGSRPPLKLRLDTIPRPNRILVPYLTESLAFVREAPRVR